MMNLVVGSSSSLGSMGGIQNILDSVKRTAARAQGVILTHSIAIEHGRRNATNRRKGDIHDRRITEHPRNRRCT